jgi:DNA-binding response OmpR family regulator
MSDAASHTSTVLVVDDDANIRTVLERMARFQGLTPVTAATVEEAVIVAQQHAITAFILDLNLKGGRSGLEVLAWLRLQPQYARTPVFVLTGQLDIRDEDRTAIRGHGAQVFYKGLSMQALFAELKSRLADQTSD